MVLAATAIPVELRPPGHAVLGFSIEAADVVANVAGYVPVGIVLAGLGPLRAILAAASITMFAETSQLVMVHRDPSPVDVVSNVIGAMLGVLACVRWKIRAPSLALNRWTTLAAGASAAVVILGVWFVSGGALNRRGFLSPGTLEAYWKLDESSGRVAVDSSGHHLEGRFSREPKRVPGVVGGAASFDGRTDSINAGRPTAFRLVGSMTLSAWINSTSYPVDDAAIVSNFDHGLGFARGFQLDTTIDRGPRTIGFKLGDACGNVMARYGATPLRPNTWYHVAGVYDADAQTMDVYLNGEPDDGFLLGSVSETHRSSRRAMSIGRRSDRAGFEFAGVLDEVRVDSRALTKADIATIMRGGEVGSLPIGATAMVAGSRRGGERQGEPPECAWSSEPEDARIPGAIAVFGVLIAIACVGLMPSAAPRLCLVVTLLAGWLFLAVTSPTLPSLKLWMFPLTSLAGGASVVAGLRRPDDSSSVT